MTTEIQVYGTDWCRLTFAIREHLTNLRLDYDYVDIDRDPEADSFIRTLSRGRRRYPAVVVAEHTVITPTLAELGKLLRDLRLESRPHPRASADRSGDREGSRPA